MVFRSAGSQSDGRFENSCYVTQILTSFFIKDLQCLIVMHKAIKDC